MYTKYILSVYIFLIGDDSEKIGEILTNALDNALEEEQTIADRIEVAGNETEIVNMLMFYRKEDENIND
ncbi:unnamed protein product [Rhizophagus irregularis]|uniref:Uncharacterized protein n=1 Tax=Rhizophagus irregularis TaxID=588596 RepID=A0A2I1H6W8_9GLOM|nr:hypothetical protein RhiirA4_473516 [Rhizophagus irregularis]CAB4422517.1 unnamed protein product [Rhizophagus irregularis]